MPWKFFPYGFSLMTPNNLSKVLPCGTCNRPAAEETMDRHHVTPQAASGGDENSNLIDLCQNCHQFIHRLTHLLRKGDTQRIAHLLNSNYSGYPLKVHDLLLKLASTAMKEEDAAVRTDDSEINIPLKLLLPVYTKLRELAKGSKCSMDKVLVELIEKEYRTRKFGSAPPQVIQRLP
jgi:hypothetical protein